MFTLAGHTIRIRSFALSRDGTRAVPASDDHTLKVWHLGRDTLELPYRALGCARAVAFARWHAIPVAGGLPGYPPLPPLQTGYGLAVRREPRYSG